MCDKPTEAEIEAFLAECPSNVPAAFCEFHRNHGAVKMNIETIGSGLVWLWPLKDVIRFSREYGFDEFAPGLLGFGTDGCGELYAIDIRKGSTNPCSANCSTLPGIEAREREFDSSALV